MAGKSSHQPVPRLVPPQGYAIVEFGYLYRSLDTVNGSHVNFIKSLKLGSIVVMTTEPLDEGFLTYVENEDITMHYLLASSQANSLPFGSCSVGISEDWMKRVLELVFSLSRDPVLLIGNALTCADVALIACLRRIQRWSLTSVLAYFRRLAGRKIFDIEQFIEFFGISMVKIPSHRIPTYLDTFLREESSTLEKSSLETKNVARNIQETDTKERSDNTISSAHVLHFADWNFQQVKCITSLDQFDPNLSLITDDITDD